MFELVLANLKTRPFRTLISITGVAIGVVLIVLFTGLANGMANDMIKRSANWNAEIVFTRPGAMNLGSSNMSVSTTYAERLLEIDGVKTVLPVGQYIKTNPNESWGFQRLDGVEWSVFSAMNGMKITRGVPAVGDQEVVVDEHHMRKQNYKLGD